MKIFLPLLFIAFCSFNIAGQNRRPATKPKVVPMPTGGNKGFNPTPAAVAEPTPSQKVVVEKANGDKITGLFVSGKTNTIYIEISGSVIEIPLSEISALRFGDAKEILKEAISSPLSFEAALVFKSGDVKPIARHTFYILDSDVVTILKDSGFKTDVRPSKGVEQDILYSISYVSDSDLVAGVPDFKVTANKLFTAIAPHTIQTFTTDFSGKASLAGLQPKKYFIFGLYAAPGNYLVWNKEIDLSKETSIVIDQNNVSGAFYRMR